MFLKIKREIRTYNDFSSLTDEELLNKYDGSFDNQIISILFDRYTHLVFGVCMKYLKNEDESKDAVMQIFETLITTLKSQKVINFKNWLYTVAKNHCLMALRKSKTTEHKKSGYLQIIKDDFMESLNEIHQHNKVDLNGKISRLKEGIELLNEEQKKCIELLYLQDKTYKEVAKITGYDLKRVKSYIQNGKRNLKIFLEQE